MMLPESVMKVMPMATQPMNDMVVEQRHQADGRKEAGRAERECGECRERGNPDRQQRALSTGGR